MPGAPPSSTEHRSTHHASAEPWHATPLPAEPGAEVTRAWLAALGEEERSQLQRRLGWETTPRPAGALDWQTALDAICSSVRSGVAHPLVTARQPFADLWVPVARHAVAALRSHAFTFAIADSAWTSLEVSLVDRLSEVATPTLWELFNRERDPQVMLLAHLDADADGLLPRAVYGRFIERHRAEALGSLLTEFPVLGRLLGTTLALWTEATIELLQRLGHDRAELDVFGIESGAPLTHVQLGLSDPHRNGRAVMVLHFGAQRLVYKPKDLRVDATFQTLLEDLNQHSSLPPLRALRMLTRLDYGYVEYLPHRPCTDAAELERFYRNAGRLTAVLHALNCTDCHNENLIAHGDQLVLVDTETLLEGELPRLDTAVNGVEEAIAPSGLTKAIAESVLASGLLPVWQFVGEQRQAQDVSAMGIAVPMQPTRRQEGWAALNTDGMVRAELETPSELPTSVPVGVGHRNPFEDHLDLYLSGFRAQAKALIARREAWLADGGLLSRFAGLPRRVVLRMTHVYYVLRQQLFAPSALVNAAAQGLVLEKLARAFLATQKRPRHWPVFDAEIRQLEQLDIPFFVHAVDGHALVLGPGMAPVDDFIRTTGLALSRARIASLDDAAIDFQCQLINGAVQARRQRPARSMARVIGTGVASSQGERRQWAEKLAAQLASLAVVDRDGVPHWLGMDLGPDGEKFCFGAVGNSLYGGSAGVAILDAALGRKPAPVFASLAALVTSQDDAAIRRFWRSQSLGLAGAGGVLLGLIELDRLGAAAPSGFRSHREVALGLLTGLTDTCLGADVDLDLMGGAAGLIGPLLQLGGAEALEWATRAGRHLIACQRDDGGWPAAAAQRARVPLTGFSHGAAGIATALGLLAEAAQDPGFLAAARSALMYERQSFDATRANWLDFRSGERDFSNTWCHGAPGIALSRLCLRGSALDDVLLDEELSVALRTTATAEPELDHLCCGALGLAAILRHGGRGDDADRLESGVLARANARGGFTMFNTSDAGVLLPGFMTGLSGIALALAHRDSALRLLSGGLLGLARSRR